ncbi:hypothetical protein GVY41_09120 [Frigidibacter albus]|uniref:Uncharacterized protein n=1 Tax=Frigidibacter albus TaxID=1465486 RepID=A0A6L8VG80_9RHOB|nr:hypothetical protein [Frigidibacter albus]MZQ89253.1 hypothetical protein [Frigidibacter albus]NBE31159.1 hypothetical protein [Frigidibacter albus]GGH53194.1 hypothetical protein GCM10011341_18430 [Frigidibacter albus]
MTAERSYTGDAEVDRLLFRWGRVVRDAEGWARGFALSIQRARKKPGWTPTPKQLAVMQRMVAELPQTEGDDPGPDLIEDVA